MNTIYRYVSYSRLCHCRNDPECGMLPEIRRPILASIKYLLTN